MSEYQPYVPSYDPVGAEPPYNAYEQVPTQGMQPYQSPMYPGGPGFMVKPEHPQATAVLILGILGFVTSITAPIAWYLGNKAKKECDVGMYTMSQTLSIGRILGKVLTIVLIVGVALSILAMIIFIVTAVLMT